MTNIPFLNFIFWLIGIPLIAFLCFRPFALLAKSHPVAGSMGVYATAVFIMPALLTFTIWVFTSRFYSDIYSLIFFAYISGFIILLIVLQRSDLLNNASFRHLAIKEQLLVTRNSTLSSVHIPHIIVRI